MNISTQGYENIVSESINQLNKMLKEISSTNIDLENKMLKVNVTTAVEGLGTNIDTEA